MLLCPCEQGFVGKSTRLLCAGVSEHKSVIRWNNPNSSVARHFKENKHTVQTLRCFGIEKVSLNRKCGDINIDDHSKMGPTVCKAL